ncbi:MAG: hypothetical protein KDA79_22550, partial [Planctomycetaceae bacterium]|nr:hypothetical protein [Planctomycetaceae bacterium]
ADRGNQAAESLQQAAAAARTAGATGSNDQTPVPADLGQRIAEAVRQLAAARQQLAEQPGNSGQAAGDSAQQQGQPGQQQAQAGGSSQPGASPAGQSGSSGQPGGGQSAGSSPSGSQPGGSSQGGSPAGPSPAEALNRTARALNRAAGQVQGRAGQSDAENLAEAGSGEPGEGDSTGQGARTAFDPARLEAELRPQQARQWGELPGTLKTEILQGSRNVPRGDYARLIRLYFEEVARSRQENRDSSRQGQP